MASGRPDYFGRTSNVTAILGTDQELWTVSDYGLIGGGGSGDVYDEFVPADQKISITYFGISCNYPGINSFVMWIDELTAIQGYFETQRDMLMGGDTGYIVNAGQRIRISVGNTYDKQIVISFMIVGFVQYI